jgi:hypothetical protein
MNLTKNLVTRLVAPGGGRSRVYGLEDRRMTIKTMVNYESYRDSLIRLLARQCADLAGGGGGSGKVADEDHGTWYREPFAPSVTTGIPPPDLAG